MNTNPDAQRIVCYGDSNTWGDAPLENRRFNPKERWTGLLQDKLGKDYEVIEEGLCGRTFKAVEIGKEYRVGLTHLKAILSTHEPISYVLVMLGTNDLKSTFQLSSNEIATHLRETIDFIQGSGVGLDNSSPQVLIVCPPPVSNPNAIEIDERLKQAPKQSLELAHLYKQVAEETDCLYLNAGDFVSLADTDGYHLGQKHHAILAQELAKCISEGK